MSSSTTVPAADERPSSSSSGEEEDICQICFLATSLLITPCQHSACKLCFEHLLLSTDSNSSHNENYRERQARQDHTDNWSELQEDEIIAAFPSRGRCPFCRRYIDMFQLQLKEKHKNNCGEHLKMAYPKDINLEETPLCGLSFFDTRRTIGDHSFHFPYESSFNNTTSTHTEDGHDTCSIGTDRVTMPFIKFNNSSPDITLDNGDPLPERKLFEHGFHYHDISQTFRGTINWTEGQHGSTFRGSHRWEVIMQFSSDFVHIAKGGILKYRPPNMSQPTAFQTPFDGWWEVMYRRTRCERTPAMTIMTAGDDVDTEEEDVRVERMQVVENSFHRKGERYVIRLGDDVDPPSITWPGMRKPDGGSYSQVVESGMDLQQKRDGPEVGDVIAWTIDHPGYHRIHWKRETKNHCTAIYRFGLGNQDSLQYRQHTVTAYTKPAYNSESLWGNAFVQDLRVGFASYHFISPEGDGENSAYISYEHHACAAWPLLDNGSPVPSRVPFVHQSFDKENRVFCGTIAWTDDYNTSWQGDKSWQYKIIFDEEYTCVKAGRMVAETRGGTEGATHTFGYDLNYINAAISIKIGLEVDAIVQNEQDPTNAVTTRIKLAIIAVNRRITNQLQEEEVSMRTLTQIQSVARGILEDGRDIVDYLS